MPTFKRTLSTIIFLLLAVGVSKSYAQSSCEGCQGQCQYCVDGQCVPRAHTFGHYQTKWRRWPEPPPSVPVPTLDAADEGMLPGSGDLDLPAAEDEGELDPDLPRRRERATGMPAVETGIDAEYVPNSSDPFEDDVEDIPPAMEGSSTRYMPRYLDGYPQQLSSRYHSSGRNPLRRDLQPQPAAMQVGYDQPVPTASLAQPIYANPLR